MSVGPDVPIEYEAGIRVVINTRSGYEYTIDGESLLVVDASEIQGTVLEALDAAG